MFSALQAIQAGQMGAQAREQRERKNAFAEAGNALQAGDYQAAAAPLLAQGELGNGLKLMQYGQQQQQTAEQEKIRKIYGVTQLLAKEPDVMKRIQLAQQMSPELGIPAPTDPNEYTDEALQRELEEMRIKGGFQEEQPEAYTLAPGARRFEGNQMVAENPKEVTPGFKTVTTDQGIFQYDPANPQETMTLLGRAPERAPVAQVTVNGDEIDTRPMTAAPSKDVQRVWDEESQTWRDEVIPGSPTARDNELLNSKAFQSVQANQEQFDAIMTNIDAADELIGPFTTGVGSYLQVIRGTPAKDLEARLETVKANIGFDKLNEMRQTSPTGGALGQVTERELKFLQSVRGSLDEQQSPAQLRQTLSEIRDSLQRLSEVREIAFKLEQQNAGEGQIVATDPLQSSDLPEGFALQGEDADLLEFMTPEERALFQGGAQ